MVGHRETMATLHDHFSDLGDGRVAGFGAVIGAAPVHMFLAPVHRCIDAPDAVRVRVGHLARLADQQVQRQAIVVLDQQRVQPAFGQRQGKVAHGKKLGARGERGQFELERMQRRGRAAFLVEDGIGLA